MSDATGNESVRERIEAELGRRWADFEREHPRLAEELGREVYIAGAEQRLRDDPAYQAAIAQGKLIAGAAELLAGLIEKAVKAALKP